jgi:deoxyribodipyrimidine photo-lyase
MSPPIHPSRIRYLNDLPATAGRFVLYWMQQSQRADWNHALEFAIGEANRLQLPLVTVFAFTPAYPEANLRHYRFMWEGLVETAGDLHRRNVVFVLRLGSPPEVVLGLAQNAALVVCDRGYLRHQRHWRREVARLAGCRVVQVESDAVVPVDEASSRQEYAARTLRPKLQRLLHQYLQPVPSSAPRWSGRALCLAGEDFSRADWLDRLNLDRSVAPATGHFRGGAREARARFHRFLEQNLTGYSSLRNQPQLAGGSAMSPYLHFGQISPLELAIEMLRRSAPAPAETAAYLEELIVRRELSFNFVEHCSEYDRYEGIPAWSRNTLERHRLDPRPVTYDMDRLEAAATHDPYWNAAMREMTATGYMHNHLRMYWGKKILEWSPDPRTAYEWSLALNNRYFLDGRDPNSYAGVGWIFGLHDRPWGERPIFGTVRAMTARGLERKCDIQGYVSRIGRLLDASGEARLRPSQS